MTVSVAGDEVIEFSRSKIELRRYNNEVLSSQIAEIASDQIAINRGTVDRSVENRRFDVRPKMTSSVVE
jgi:hypothetical protein